MHVTELPAKGIMYEPQNESVPINYVAIPSKKTSSKGYAIKVSMGNVEIKLNNHDHIRPINATKTTKLYQ